jgi:hypothetical protein
MLQNRFAVDAIPSRVYCLFSISGRTEEAVAKQELTCRGLNGGDERVSVHVPPRSRTEKTALYSAGMVDDVSVGETRRYALAVSL